MFHPSLFHARLSGLCKAKDTSVTLFITDVLCISSSAATNWKNGSYPSSEVIYAVAEYFGVSTDYLFGLSDTPERRIPSVTPEETDLLNNLRTADPNAREVLLASLRAGLSTFNAQKKPPRKKYPLMFPSSASQPLVLRCSLPMIRATPFLSRSNFLAVPMRITISLP